LLRNLFIIIDRLPVWLKLPMARLASFLAWHFAARSRKVTALNLQWCLAELDEQQRKRLA